MSSTIRYTVRKGAIRSAVTIERWPDTHALDVEHLPALRVRSYEYEANEDEWYGFSAPDVRVRITDRNRHNFLDSLLDM